MTDRSTVIKAAEKYLFHGVLVRRIVEGEQGVAFYDLELNISDLPVLVAERFRVVDGLITEIEVLFHAQAPIPVEK